MQQVPSRTLWIDYLRSFLTVLVVAHHSSLAYTTFANFDKVAYIRSTHPVVDSRRWVGLDIFENFNDVFFMSLMFLIAGLFVAKSVRRKGPGAFLRDRFYRLFVPFVIGGTILNLIAHYPAYLLAHGSTSLRAYVADFFFIEQWPVGPPWFIWVLFVFNVVFVLIYLATNNYYILSTAGTDSPTTAPGSIAVTVLRMSRNNPVAMVLLWFLFTFILYVPLAFWLGPGKWAGFGPFDFQVSRVAWYLGYFLLGAWLGNVYSDRPRSGTFPPFAHLWPLWLLLCAITYTLLTLMSPFLTNLVKQKTLPEFTAYLIYFSIYVLSCTFSCIAFLTTFRTLVKKPNAIGDSLSRHAYLIYLLHYPFVIWAQYCLLEVPFPAFVKFLISFAFALSASWGTAIQVRKIDLFRKYL